MEHRHIKAEKDQWGVALIHSIWERGSEQDILELMRQVRVNPAAAKAVLRAIPSSQVYGWPKFFSLYLEKIYGK